MKLGRSIAVIGSRSFANYAQLSRVLADVVTYGDALISGGAVGADSMAQRYARDYGLEITIIYPDYRNNGRGATFIRNKTIVERSDLVLAFYSKGSFQQGGTANTIHWAQELGVPYYEYEEEVI